MIAANIEVEFGADTRQLEAGTKRAGSVVDSFVRRGSSVRSNPFTNWTRGIRDIGTSARTADGMLKNMLSTAGGFMAANVFSQMAGGVRNLVGGFISSNAEVETLTNTLNIAAGSVEEGTRLFNELRTMAAKTPFEFPELVTGARNLEALGNEAMDFLPTLGNVAAGTNKTIDQVVQAFLDAQVGEFERLKEFGIRVNQEGSEAIFQWVENGKTMTKAVEKGNTELYQSTLMAIWNDRYAGAMDTLSSTFQGKWSTLTDNVNMTLQRLGKPLFDFAKQGVTVAVEFFDAFNAGLDDGESLWRAGWTAMERVVYDMFGKRVGRRFTDTVSMIEEGIRDIRAVVVPGFRILRTVFTDAFGLMLRYRQPVEGALKGILAGFLALRAITTVTGIVRTFVGVIAALTSPIGLVVAALSLFGAAYQTNFLGFADLVNGAASTVRSFVDEAASKFRFFAGAGINPLSSGMLGLLVTLRRTLGRDNPVTQFVNLVNQGFVRFQRDVFPVLQALGSYFLHVARNGDYLNDWITHMPDAIKPFVRWLGVLVAGVQNVIAGFQSGGIEGAAGAVVGFLSRLPIEAQRYTDALLGILGQAGGWLLEKGSEIVGGFVEGLQARWPEIGEWFRTVFTAANIGSMVGPIGSYLLEKGLQLLGGLWDGIRQTWPQIESWFGTNITAETVAGFLIDAGAWLITQGKDILMGLLSGLVQGLPAVVNWLHENVGPDAVGRFFLNTITFMPRIGFNIMNALLVGAINEANRGLFSWLSTINETIMGYFNNAGDWLLGAGANIIGGLIEGIKSKMPDLEVSLDLSGVVPDWVNNPLDARSPARKLYPAGRNIVDGIIEGARERFPLLKREMETGARSLLSGLDSSFWTGAKSRIQADTAASRELYRSHRGMGFDLAKPSGGNAEPWYLRLINAFGDDQRSTGQTLYDALRGQGSVRDARAGMRSAFGTDTAGFRQLLTAVRALAQYGTPSGTRMFEDFTFRADSSATPIAPVARAAAAQARPQAPISIVVNANGIKDPEEVANLVAVKIEAALGRIQSGAGIA